MDGKGKIYDIDGLANWAQFRQIQKSGEALAEWRSCVQDNSGTPSTSSFWESDSDSGDEFKPSEMYGNFTWIVDKFSQLSSKQLKSDVFEVNGYKWCISMYPQGRDYHHLSLYLCVANHSQLLPGWGHFAQFTLALENKNRKKSKHYDTFHRFCKKEHALGWEKFIELSKVQDGFLTNDALKIKVQVQIIRKRAHRPFRCLDHKYRKELLGVYLSHVEQVCRKFVEDQKSKLKNLLQDKARWSSFCTFWSGMDPNSKLQLSRERVEMIFKVVLKHFFTEKQVTSALVMDSLYSGLKALQVESKCKGGKENVLQFITKSRPIVYVDGDMFILADDLLSLLEKSPRQSVHLKDGKESSSRPKAESNGQDFNRDSYELDERCLAEFGRRTIEICVLSHIFSQKVEVAFQEAIAIRMQEDLICEEDEAREAELEQKAKREAADKENRLKKKTNKQKRSRIQKGQRKVETGDHENYNISENVTELSGKSILHSAKVSNQCDGDSDLRDYENDNASVWLTGDDTDGSSVTADSAKYYTCCSSESSTRELDFERMCATPLDGAQPLEVNGWSEGTVSDNGSWNVHVRNRSRRCKVTCEQIKRTADRHSESTVITNGLGCENTCSCANYSAIPGNTPDGLLKDHVHILSPVDKVEHGTSREVTEGSFKQLSVPEASHVRIRRNHLTSNINPKVRRNNTQTSVIYTFPQAGTDSSSKKRNGQNPRHGIGKDNLKPLSKFSSKPLLDQELHVDLGPAPKAVAATVSSIQPVPKQLLPSRDATPSLVTQFQNNVNIPKALDATGQSLLQNSNCSVADTVVQHSQAPLVLLSFDTSANDSVPGLTFGSLPPKISAGEPQLSKTSDKGSPKVPDSPLQSNASPTVDQSASVDGHIGLAGGSIRGFPSLIKRPSQTLNAPFDDFPHIDIINQLFDEDTENDQGISIHYSGGVAFGPITNKQWHL